MANGAGTYAVFNTTEGKITVRLFEAEAPITVKNFIELGGGREGVVASGHAREVEEQALRRHNFSPRDSRLHDSGRRSRGHRHGRAGLPL